MPIALARLAGTLALAALLFAAYLLIAGNAAHSDPHAGGKTRPTSKPPIAGEVLEGPATHEREVDTVVTVAGHAESRGSAEALQLDRAERPRQGRDGHCVPPSGCYARTSQVSPASSRARRSPLPFAACTRAIWSLTSDS